MYAPGTTFTTPEQLDQLPLGTVVLSGGKHPAVFVLSLRTGERLWHREDSLGSEARNSAQMRLPVTLVILPGKGGRSFPGVRFSTSLVHTRERAPPCRQVVGLFLYSEDEW